MTSVSEKKLRKKKEGEERKGKSTSNKFLININVVGSAGPIRFVVKDDENSLSVIETALKMYSRERRLPVLGVDANGFLLYPANAGFDALKPCESIGVCGVRNFLLCKNESNPNMTEARSQVVHRKGSGWRSWLHKSFKIRSH